MYKDLEAYLVRTRKTITQACKELGIDSREVDADMLLIAQCSHCSVWNKNLITDLDQNPICVYCRDLIGL